MPAEPARQVAEPKAGGDADDKLLVDKWFQRDVRFAHVLGFDREQQGVAASAAASGLA